MKINILCYGDSNTWGYIPGTFDPKTFLFERFDFSKRWPGILQNRLGNAYQIIENGLGNRTTDIDDPTIPDRNGLLQLPVALQIASPVDLVIIMLGVNDLKAMFNRTGSDIVKGISNIIDTIRANQFVKNCDTKILIVPPPIITKEDGFGDAFKGAAEKSKMLPELLNILAIQKGCYYFYNQDVKFSNIDGTHLDENGHLLLGVSLADYILMLDFKS